MFSALRAQIGDWQRRVSKPSKEVLMMGYASKSSVNKTNELRSVYKLTLLNNSIGPLNHKPSGITTVPPPFEFTSLIASLIAWVLRVTPSPFAPKSLMLTDKAGKLGCCTFGISKGTSL